MDDTLGSIKVGKTADLVVLKGNLFEVGRYDIHNIKVDMTIRAGETVYKRNWLAVIKEKMFDLYTAYFIWSNS